MFKKLTEKKMRNVNGGYRFDDNTDDILVRANGSGGLRGVRYDNNHSAFHYVRDIMRQK